MQDEPTSGLDARAAAIVMRTVRNTVNTGRTVVCTIHQPSIDIFEVPLNISGLLLVATLQRACLMPGSPARLPHRPFPAAGIVSGAPTSSHLSIGTATWAPGYTQSLAPHGCLQAFDELHLLKRGGKTIYAGPTGTDSAQLVSYFEAVPGVPPLQPGMNPATWMLEITAFASKERLGVDFADIWAQSGLARQGLYRTVTHLEDVLLCHRQAEHLFDEPLPTPVRSGSGNRVHSLLSSWRQDDAALQCHPGLEVCTQHPGCVLQAEAHAPHMAAPTSCNWS